MDTVQRVTDDASGRDKGGRYGLCDGIVRNMCGTIQLSANKTFAYLKWRLPLFILYKMYIVDILNLIHN